MARPPTERLSGGPILSASYPNLSELVTADNKPLKLPLQLSGIALGVQ